MTTGRQERQGKEVRCSSHVAAMLQTIDCSWTEGLRMEMSKLPSDLHPYLSYAV